ncbi:hypothetical protein [Salinivibrio sp. ES.052]|uniref:hypothetical protein n=1 Tax=Salinivibrio sp. ES.052 TaxID=1882823 RepID=UPI0009260CDC|nr:hypothetical protein [Salinivibrio sp. ES.052]SIN87924.1 hypothetical protein SAMN05444724_1012 [Salinivibrio sp. ES.052]
MIKIMAAACLSVFLVGCSLPKMSDLWRNYSTIGLNEALRGAQQDLIHCRYDKTLDTAQRYTVIGTEREKVRAFELMGIAYSEQENVAEFDHTLQRFLFSTPGRSMTASQVQMQWQQAQLDIEHQREAALSQTHCLQSTDIPKTGPLK